MKKLSVIILLSAVAIAGAVPFLITIGSADIIPFSRVILLLHMNNSGEDVSTFTDSSSINRLTVTGGLAIQAVAALKYGARGGQFVVSTTDYLTQDGGSDFAFGTANFSIEFWMKANANGTSMFLYDGRPTTTQGVYPTLYRWSDNRLYYFVNSADRINGATILATNTWYFVALIRSSGSTKLYLDGVQEGATYTDANSYLNGAARPAIGINGHTAGSYYEGYLDDFRVTKAARNPLPIPTAQFPDQ